MTYTTIALTLTEGDIATLYLRAKKGSMGPQFWAEMRDVLPVLAQKRAVIVRGEELFSAGLDVAATLPALGNALGNKAAFAEVVAPMQAAFDGLAALPVPVIAAVHGWCIGAGLELIAACDFRLCSDSSHFSLPEVRLGIVADLGGLQRLPPLIGKGWTQHLALTGQAITAQQAQQIGLVTEVLPTPEALFARAQALAEELVMLPAHALSGSKQVLNDALPLRPGMQQAADWNALHMRLDEV